MKKKPDDPAMVPLYDALAACKGRCLLERQSMVLDDDAGAPPSSPRVVIIELEPTSTCERASSCNAPIGSIAST